MNPTGYRSVLLQFSCSVVSDTLQHHELQHARLPCPSATPRVHSNSRPSSQWCHQPSHPLSSPSLPAPNPPQHQSLFQWVNSSHEVTKVLEFQLQHHSLQRNPRAELLSSHLNPCCGSRSLGWEDSLDEENPSSVLAWRIPWAEKPGRL